MFKNLLFNIFCSKMVWVVSLAIQWNSDSSQNKSSIMPGLYKIQSPEYGLASS